MRLMHGRSRLLRVSVWPCCPQAGFVAAACLAGAALADAATAPSPRPPQLLTRSEAQPGAANPITNPKKLTLFQVSTIGLLASQNTAAYTDLFDFAANDAGLTRWSMTAQALQDGDPCIGTPRRRLGHGRISSPEFEQAVCMTSFGLTVYTSPLTINDGSHVTFAFTRPGVSTIGRNFDVATGNLSRRPGKDQQPHQQIVAAYTNLDQRLEVDIIDWTLPDGTGPSRGELKLSASYVGPDDEKPSGDVAVSLGDFKNDGTLQIITATDVSGRAGSGRIRLALYTYDPAAKVLTRSGSSYPLDIPQGTPTSVVLAAADFAGRGYEQPVLGYVTPAGGGSQSQFTLHYFDPGASQIGPPKASRTVAAVAPGSYVDIAPGLFRFNPKEAPAGAADPFFRRQLAMAYAAPDGSAFAGIAAIEGESPDFHMGRPARFSLPGRPIATNGIGPSLAVGNFIGLNSKGIDPLDQIALALPLPAGSPGALTPELVAATVKPQNFDISPVWRNGMPRYTSLGNVFSFPVIAYDRGGRSYYLGNPAHIQVPALIDPQYVINMPPRHVDALPKDALPRPKGNALSKGDDDPYIIENLTGLNASGFTVRLEDSDENVLTQTSTDTSSSQFGAGVSQTVGGTVSAGVMDIGTIETSTSVRTAVSYETNTVERSINRTYNSVSTQRSATTTEDDHLIFNMRTVDVWRYPVYGLDKKRSDQYPFYDFIIPGPLVQYSGGGLSFDWYSPAHQNYNAASYPPIQAGGVFAQDIGKFTYTKDGQSHTLQTPLNMPTVRTIDGNEQTFSLNYTNEVGSDSEKTFSYTLSDSLDISVGFNASATVELFSGSASYDGSVSISDRSSWETAILAGRSMKNSRGITLSQPDIPGIAAQAYNYQTLVYITGNGGFKVAHSTDPLGSSAGAGWWRRTYGSKPDPALNLPFRMVYDGSEWKIASGDQYHWLRGLTPTEPMPDKISGAYRRLAGGVDQGAIVRLAVPVYNYSLRRRAENVVVAFAYQALDPEHDYAPIGDFTAFATAKPVTIDPRGVAVVDVNWDTKGLGGRGAGTPYRFQVTVDPENAIDKLHGADPEAGANNVGLWPWNTGFWVFNSGNKAIGGRGIRGSGKVGLHLNVKEGVAASAGMTDFASVAIDMPAPDSSLRHLIVSAVDPSGERIALAGRSLFGLGPGRQQFEIPIASHGGPSAVQAWLSAGALPGEPLTGTWATETRAIDAGSPSAVAIHP
jgi:hypothetical protein